MRPMADGEFVKVGQVRCRVLGRRDCAYCGDTEAVIIHSGLTMKERESVRYCSRRCARYGEKNSAGRRAFSSRRAFLELLAAFEQGGIAALEVAAFRIYDRGYKTGYTTGTLSGTNKERRRIYRIAMERKARAA